MLKPLHRELTAKTYLSTAYFYNIEDFPYLRDIYDRNITDKWIYSDIEDLMCEDKFIDCCEDGFLAVMLNQAWYARYNDRRIGYDTVGEFYLKLKGKVLELQRKYDVMFKSAKLIKFPLLTTDLETETTGQDVSYTREISVRHGSAQNSGKSNAKSVENNNRSNKAIAVGRKSQKHDSLTTGADDARHIENRDGGTARVSAGVIDTAGKLESSNHSASFHDATSRSDSQSQTEAINTGDNLGFNTDTPQDKQDNILPSFQSNIRGGHSSMNKGIATSYERGSMINNNANDTQDASTAEGQDETIGVDARIDYSVSNGENRTNEDSYYKGSMDSENVRNSKLGLESTTNDSSENQALTTIKGASVGSNQTSSIGNTITYDDAKTDKGSYADRGNVSKTRGFAGNQANLIRAYREVIGRNIEEEYLNEFEDLFLQIEV